MARIPSPAKPVNACTRVDYRLTPRTRRALDVGLGSPDEAPPITIGGCRLYRTDEPWVRREVAGGWRLARLGT